MSDKPETLAAILAEARNKYTVHECNECDYRKSCDLRFDCDECKTKRKSISLAFGIEDDYFTKLLDRIEAAAERERNAHTNDIHDALYMATGIPGNAAAMREALEWVADFSSDDYIDDEYSVDGENLQKASERARAALAAPTRNCDRFATAEDAFKAWESDNKKPPEQCFLQWLFAPAEGVKE